MIKGQAFSNIKAHFLITNKRLGRLMSLINQMAQLNTLKSPPILTKSILIIRHYNSILENLEECHQWKGEILIILVIIYNKIKIKNVSIG